MDGSLQRARQGVRHGARIVDDLTVMIITFNEADNIERTLDAARWAREILIVDSGSTDETLEIVARYPQARVVTRAFDSFANQCNFGLGEVTTEWVLSMDADYVLTPDCAAEIQALPDESGVDGYVAGFIYCVHGRRLRGTLYPPRTVLYRHAAGRYRDEGHGHRLHLDSAIRALSARILHDDRKPLARWFRSQKRYARKEAEYLASQPREALSRTDRLRRMGWPAPLLVFFYTLIVKGCLFDGWPGWHYVLQRTLAETMIALEVVDAKFTRSRLDAS